ncbi:MAG: NADPH-dependent glutamate synthase [Campylobacteraceae bacterium]|nr:NADPH-dependent glutamate synthase [Campylobacteraceae bacterium]
MFKIYKKKSLAPGIILMEIKAPMLVKNANPGQFLIVKAGVKSERIPLTICDYDKEKGSVTIVFQVVGVATKEMAEFEVGESFSDVVGPLGMPSGLIYLDPLSRQKERIVFIAGGVGTAPVYPQVKWCVENGLDVVVIIGARTKDLVIFEYDFRALTSNVHVCTDDGSYGFHGNVTNLLEHLVKNKKERFTHAVAIGPMIMMKFATLKAHELGLSVTVSLNPLMVDGTGMCGACRVEVGKQVKFACVDGPEFDGADVDFDEAQRRLIMREKEELHCDGENPICPIHEDPNIDPKARANPRLLDADGRIKSFNEVNLGYTLEAAILEANRCLECKRPKCVTACPVGINIPGFLAPLKSGDLESAATILSQDTKLPSVCGRVCPQERQCEGSCIVGRNGQSVAIGLLERMVGDWALENVTIKASPKGKKRVAIVGSGPAGLSAAAELAVKGFNVEVFESLHLLGGVLSYGIPEFRLPKSIVEKEIKRIEDLGVKFHTNVVVGKTIFINDMFTDGFDAVFIGSGAGYPKFMGIKGEDSNGVLSANEFLTRVNLMKSNLPDYHTPTGIGKKVAVIGAGNVSMDAARVAKRLGAQVYILYRRGEEEIPARLEEVKHAKEEGVVFHLLTNPKEILSDESGSVKAVLCEKMKLGTPDSSGRRKPEVVLNSVHALEVDTVIMSIGTMPNEIITGSTEGLKINENGTIAIKDGLTKTTYEGVFAGGDIVTGAATVIEAMGAGKAAAREIEAYLAT